jgi:hypothetical protein
MAKRPRPAAADSAPEAIPKGPKMPQLEEGRVRHFVDLQERHSEYLVRYAALLSVDKRRPQTVADAIEHIVRHTMMLDQTKAGQFVNANTVPANKV